jgi:hypothetical protein
MKQFPTEGSRPQQAATIAKLFRVNDAVEFRVGTASWTEPSLVNSNLFYPRSLRSAEERLRFYAERFNTVEVDSAYYITWHWSYRVQDRREVMTDRAIFGRGGCDERKSQRCEAAREESVETRIPGRCGRRRSRRMGALPQP